MDWFLGHHKKTGGIQKCHEDKSLLRGKNGWPGAGAGKFTFLLPGLTGHPAIIVKLVLCVAVIYSPKSINNFQRTKRHICGSGLDPDL